ncbi:STAS domain-containing protein [candidate division KSB1 bacterium]|nr:STAS domain-containing protein [candidate division KSB1 bacterium]
MEIRQKKLGSATVLEMQGDIVGAAESSMLIDLLHDLLEAGQKQVVIDLTHVNWMNSSGLGTLISGLQTMRQNGGDLKLSGLSDKIKNLFSITKLLSVFEIHASSQDAIDSFASKN